MEPPLRIAVEAEDDVSRSEYDCSADINTLIKEAAKDLISTQIGLKTGNMELIPDDYFGSRIKFRRG